MSVKDVVIGIIARDMASGTIDGVTGKLGGLGGAVKGAAGMIAAVGGAAMVMAGVSGLGDLARSAFDATSNTERLTASMGAMLSREIMSSSIKKETIKVGSQVVQITAKQSEEIARLTTRPSELRNSIAVANEKLGDATKKGKESAAELAVRRDRIAKMNAELAKTGTEIQKSAGQSGQTVGIYKTVTTQTMTLAEAQKAAAEKAKDLVKWVKQVGIESPFSKDDVAESMKMAMTFGMNTEQAKRLTMASVNLASATGGTGDVVSRTARAMGEMMAKGKLTGGEMLQFTNAAIPMRDILIESGKIAGLTRENFSKYVESGLIPAEKAMTAYTEYVEKNFGSAAKDQSNTLAGLQNSWGDLKEQILETAIGPFFKAIQPYLVDFIAILQTPQVTETLTKIGTSVGQMASAIMGGLASAVPVIAGLFQTLAGGGAGGLDLSKMFPPEAASIINQIIGAIQFVATVMISAFTPAFITAKEVVENVLTAIFSVVSGILSNVKVFLATHGVEIMMFFSTTWMKIGSIVNDALKLIDATIGEVLRRVGAFISTHGEAIQAVFNVAWQAIKLVVETVLGAIGAVIRIGMQLFSGDAEGALATFKGFFESTWNGLLSFLNNILPDVTKFGEKFINYMVDSFKKNAGVVFEALKKIILDAVGGVAKFLGIDTGGGGDKGQKSPGTGAGVNMVGNAARFGASAGTNSGGGITGTGGRVTKHVVYLGEREVGEFLIDWYTQTVFQERLRSG